MSTIGEVAEYFDLPISTLRYYDKEGLFPNMKRTSGIRVFTDIEIGTLHMIECMKRSGMEIKDIKDYMQMCQEGPETYEKRGALFAEKQKILEAEVKKLEKYLAMCKYKQWYYKEAEKDGNEDRLLAMLPNNLPEDIQPLYDFAHTDTRVIVSSDTDVDPRSLC